MILNSYFSSVLLSEQARAEPTDNIKHIQTLFQASKAFKDDLGDLFFLHKRRKEVLFVLQEYKSHPAAACKARLFKKRAAIRKCCLHMDL